MPFATQSPSPSKFDDLRKAAGIEPSEQSGGVFEKLKELDPDGLNKNDPNYIHKRNELQASNDYYANKLKTDYDRVKADENKDHYVSRDEYENYIVKSEEAKATTSTVKNSESTFQKNMNDLNWTILGSVFIVCVTIVVIFLLKSKSKSS